MSLIGLFGDSLVSDAYRTPLAILGVMLIVGSFAWPWVMRWQFGEPPEQSPIHFAAITSEVPFGEDADVNGIIWKKGYSYVQIKVTNLVKKPMKDLEIIMDFCDLWISEIVSVPPSPEVKLSAIGAVFPMAAIGVAADGRMVSMPIRPLKQWTAKHRLNCPVLGSRGEIVIELAVVKPKVAQDGLAGDDRYQSTPPVVEALLMEVSFTLDQKEVSLSGELPVRMIRVPF